MHDLLLDYLAKAEGTVLHHLRGEKDVTSPYGIYRYVHPNEEIFKYIDSIANSNGIYGPSKEWTQEDIDVINEHLDPVMTRKLANIFYNNYIKNTPYNMLPYECKLSFFSMYTNSKTKAIKSIQQSIIDMNKTGSMKFEHMSIVDGYPGAKTNACVEKITKQHDVYLNYYFETLMISNMKDEYIELTLANPERYMKFLNGWKNRMDILQQMK